MDNDLIERIINTDWESYCGPEYYDSREIVDVLTDLVNFDESKAPHGLDNKVLFAVGNNHAGTYYPALLAAVDILMEIERSASNQNSRSCAYAILNNLYYFEPELGSYLNLSYSEIEKIIKQKLMEYADET